MRSDPRHGLYASTGVAAIAGVWLLAIFFADPFLAHAFGMARHAITYLALIAFFSALVSALMFRAQGQLRDDLLAGRDVIAKWRADERAWNAVAQEAAMFDRRQMRQVLWTIWIFIALIFGGFALFDRTVAPVMIGVGGALCVVIGCAYVLGVRLHERNLAFHDGLVIAGLSGMLANGVLHDWAGWRTRLRSISLYPDTDPPRLEITYSVRMRANTRLERVVLPVSATDLDAAKRVASILAAGL